MFLDYFLINKCFFSFFPFSSPLRSPQQGSRRPLREGPPGFPDRHFPDAVEKTQQKNTQKTFTISRFYDIILY